MMLLPPLKIPSRPKKFLLKFDSLEKQEIRKKHPALLNNNDKHFVISAFIPNKLVACRSTKRSFKSPFKVVELYGRDKLSNDWTKDDRSQRFFDSLTPKVMNIVSPISLNNRLKRSKLKSLSPPPQSYKLDTSLLSYGSIQKRRLLPKNTPNLYRPNSNKSSSDSGVETDLINLFPHYLN